MVFPLPNTYFSIILLQNLLEMVYVIHLEYVFVFSQLQDFSHLYFKVESY